MAAILKDMRDLREALAAPLTGLSVKADLDRVISAEVRNMLPAAEAHRRAEEFGLEVLARMPGESGGEK